jgi:hypothetical protein
MQVAVTELLDLLTDALDEAPRKPAEGNLGGGVTATAYWSFDPRLEIVLADASRLPADGQAQSAWKKRLDRRPVPLVLIVESDGQSLVVGPGGEPPPVASIDARLIVAELTAARDLDALDVRRRLPEAIDRARGAGGLSGLRNVGLFSTHFLRARAPRLSEWSELEEIGRAAVRAKRVPERLEALGFEPESKAEGVYLLRVGGRSAAAVLAYPSGHDLDRAAAGGELPIAGLLREMDEVGASWGILASGDIWRLYAADHPSRTTSFVELDLAMLSDPAYAAALFSDRAVRDGGLAEQIAKGSQDFAVGLGDRLRSRIYEKVVPRIARAIADELERLDEAPHTRQDLAGVYDATLTLLYRLLFILYAEAREYLPVGASVGYREHSLRKRIDAVIETMDSDREFDSRATDIWSDLQETFDAVSSGHTEWGVPLYNGGLFLDDETRPAGQILAKIQPSNAGLGEALYHLAADADDDDTGRIDYSDLGIRHLGDIYEGLLQFEAERAAHDLTYSTEEDAYVDAEEGEAVVVPEGELYLRNKKGGRKASGAFYTPQVVVRHVVERALLPQFERHLSRIQTLAAEDEEAAARELWNFRVCDPAMGSGHFLVDALDVLTDRTAAFLSECPLKPVRAVLGQLREMVHAQSKDLPNGVLADIRDVELLKRVVLKRVIYGVDHNPMAVELAKLGLWLDAFVPGLPLSYLDHNLRCGNSLIGMAGDEVLAALQPREATLEESWIAESLRTATDQARAAVDQVETRAQDLAIARDAEHARREAVQEVTTLYDRWTAEPFGLADARSRIADRDTLEAADDEREAVKIAANRGFFHWPLEFPEVFGSEHGGFDVAIGNPPWDKVRFEATHHWVSRFPGLNALSDTQRLTEIEELRQRFPLEQEREDEAHREAEAMQEYYRHDYELQGSHGHLDLAKLFLERSFALVGSEGSIGLVLPRQFLVLRGWESLRERAFTDAHCAVTQLSNRAHWVFPDVDGRYMFALLARQPAGKTSDLELRGGVDRPELMDPSTGITLTWSIDEVRGFSEILAVPVLPQAEDVEVFAKLVAQKRLGDMDAVFGGVHSDTPYDWTDAARSSVVDRAPFPEDDYPVLQTRHVAHFKLDRSRPFAKGVPADDATSLLDEKWRRSRALSDSISPQPTSPDEALDLYRVVYRYATMATNSRTLIPALAPRGFLPAKGYAHSAVALRNDPTHRLALLGCLSTVTADWWARRFVDRHVTSSVIRSIPAPDWDSDQLTHAARLTARLACEPDDPVLAELGLADTDVATEDVDRIPLQTELELLYAGSVGLTRKDLAWMVEDFNLEGIPESLRKSLAAATPAESVTS